MLEHGDNGKLGFSLLFSGSAHTFHVAKERSHILGSKGRLYQSEQEIRTTNAGVLMLP